jgi:cell division protein FtsB
MLEKNTQYSQQEINKLVISNENLVQENNFLKEKVTNLEEIAHLSQNSLEKAKKELFYLGQKD